MKIHKFFLGAIFMLFAGGGESHTQTTQSTNAIIAGSYLGTSNNNDVEFRRGNLHSGLISTKNTFFGLSSGTLNASSGSYQLNSAFGINALRSYNSTNNVKGNSAFGYRALEFGLASYNNAFGYDAMRNNVSGSYNIGFGHRALAGGANASGQFNIAIGSRTMENHISGSNNIGLGHRTLENNTIGSNNIGVGYYTIPNSKGNNNIAFGYFTGVQLSTGSQNVFLGHQSGKNISTGSYNVIIGSSGFANAPSTAISVGNNTSKTVLIADGGGNQRMLIHNNGYTGIGIGTNIIPKNRLEIGNGVSGTSGLRFKNYTSASSASFPSNGKVLTVNASGDVVLTTDQGGSIGMLNNIYENDGTINQSTTISNNRRVDMNDRNIWFDTSTSSKHGNIYIGSQPFYPTNTGNYGLYVEGGILTEKVKVALRGSISWADYVFADDYKLPSLKEVEAFIKKNKHLPGVESADKLVENGLNLGEMQAKQMEKIEELTLYAIEQDKLLTKQSKEIEILKAQVKILLERQ